MSARAARFEVVRTAAGWHARFRAVNGRIVWVTESFTRKRAAEQAVDLILGVAPLYVPTNRAPEVREVDEREVTR